MPNLPPQKGRRLGTDGGRLEIYSNSIIKCCTALKKRIMCKCKGPAKHPKSHTHKRLYGHIEYVCPHATSCMQCTHNGCTVHSSIAILVHYLCLLLQDRHLTVNLPDLSAARLNGIGDWKAWTSHICIINTCMYACMLAL